MSGGITQLLSIGAQDTYLTGQPQVSFFQSVYKRHTNFARVTQRQVIQGTIGSSAMTSIRVERKGDLLNYMYLTKREGNGTASPIGVDEIDHIDLLIGGQVIDSQSDEFIRYVADPYLCSTQQKASYSVGDFYPLRFWFCENWSSSLPLIALQFHDVEIRIYWNSPYTNKIYEAWGDFTYLDNAERQLFSNTQKVLIYQTQKQAISIGSTNQNLVFNQPVKFLASSTNLSGIVSDTSTLLLQINGVDVGEQKQYVPHFTTAPVYYTYPWSFVNANDSFLLPFCLDVSSKQPSGTLNFSRLDSARLVTNGTFDGTYIYAVNYNVLKFENGMAGLLYAN